MNAIIKKLTLRGVLRVIIDFTLKNFWSPSIKPGDTVAINFIAKTPYSGGKKSFKAKFIRFTKLGPLPRNRNIHVTELVIDEVPHLFFGGRLVKCKKIDTGTIWYEFTFNTYDGILPKFYSVTVGRVSKRKTNLELAHGDVAI